MTHRSTEHNRNRYHTDPEYRERKKAAARAQTKRIRKTTKSTAVQRKLKQCEGCGRMFPSVSEHESYCGRC